MNEGNEIFKCPGMEIDPTRHEVLINGRPVDLTVKEFNLLQFLVKNEGRVFNRDQLLKNVWGEQSEIKSRTVDVHIRRIREKIAEMSKSLLTLRGVGYKFRINGKRK
ncbi:MAG TPA: winged helix-turn-helix domain-containing protein [Candidatus Omnitrophota bacterium]|nr:winged helix-turn-helix domain-containing protein [Candidatus Omnitrophota bacterium]